MPPSSDKPDTTPPTAAAPTAAALHAQERGADLDVLQARCLAHDVIARERTLALARDMDHHKSRRVAHYVLFFVMIRRPPRSPLDASATVVRSFLGGPGNDVLRGGNGND